MGFEETTAGARKIIRGLEHFCACRNISVQ